MGKRKVKSKAVVEVHGLKTVPFCGRFTELTEKRLLKICAAKASKDRYGNMRPAPKTTIVETLIDNEYAKLDRRSA